MVVVMSNFSFSLGISGTCPTSLYGRDLIAAVIPYVQSHFDDRGSPPSAFAGLSCGGGFAGTLLVDRTSEFGYFGLMSPGPLPLPALSAAQAAAIKHVGVMVGGGAQDPIHSVAATDLTSLRQAGDPPFTDFINGGHDWDVWRTLLRDFLTRVSVQARQELTWSSSLLRRNHPDVATPRPRHTESNSGACVSFRLRAGRRSSCRRR